MRVASLFALLGVALHGAAAQEASITGIVYGEDCIKGTVPFVGANVRLTGGPAKTDVTLQTTNDGSFTFEKLESGKYGVSAEAPNGSGNFRIFVGHDKVTIDVSDTASRIVDFFFEPFRTISGTVVDTDSDPLETSKDVFVSMTPSLGATVFVHDSVFSFDVSACLGVVLLAGGIDIDVTSVELDPTVLDETVTLVIDTTSLAADADGDGEIDTHDVLVEVRLMHCDGMTTSPLKDAKVTFVGAGPDKDAVTDKDGGVAFLDIHSGSYSFKVEPMNGIDAFRLKEPIDILELRVSSDEASPKLVELTIIPIRSVSGTVLLSTEQHAASGVDVFLVEEPETTVTFGEGNFVLPDVTACELTVVATNGDLEATATVGAGFSDVGNIRLELEEAEAPPGYGEEMAVPSVKGEVRWRKCDGSVVPLVGAVVSAPGANDAITDANGRFELVDVSSGVHIIEVDPKMGIEIFKFEEGNVDEVTVRDDGSIAKFITFTVVPLRSIGGAVFKDDNEEEDVSISLRAGCSEADSLDTQTSGEFAFADVSTCALIVVATKDDFTAAVTVPPGTDNVDDIELNLEELDPMSIPNVEGIVHLRECDGAIVPLVDATVMIGGVDATTDEGGRFELVGVPSGDQIIGIGPNGIELFIVEGGDMLTVPPDGSGTLCTTFTVVPVRSISGTVFKDNKKESSVSVTLEAGVEGPVKTSTDTDGNFLFDNASTCDLSIDATSNGLSASKDVGAGLGAVDGIDLILKGGASGVVTPSLDSVVRVCSGDITAPKDEDLCVVTSDGNRLEIYLPEDPDDMASARVWGNLCTSSFFTQNFEDTADTYCKMIYESDYSNGGKYTSVSKTGMRSDGAVLFECEDLKCDNIKKVGTCGIGPDSLVGLECQVAA